MYKQRKLPWESTSQATLTLALVNPVLWYILDQSVAGFVLSTTLAITGTAVLLGVNPDIIPLPAGTADQISATAIERIQAHGVYSGEAVGIFTWVASVLFCSCVCFRSIGKRLELPK
jgi:hypothetical protein